MSEDPMRVRVAAAFALGHIGVTDFKPHSNHFLTHRLFIVWHN